MTETRHVKIGSSFDFDTESVADGFNAHVREQLPWYELVTHAIVQIARHYIPHNGLVYDIGASNGNIGRALHDVLEERSANLVAIEPASAMVDHYQGPGQVIHGRAEDFPFEPYDLAVANLALMFVAPAEVRGLVERLREATRPGGALVVVERMHPASGYPALVMARLTLEAKMRSGASSEEILAKELSLAGVQRPLCPDVLGAGAVEWFRFGDFAGYLIEAQP